jgi:choline dehydrogenase-like flavoprotein
LGGRIIALVRVIVVGAGIGGLGAAIGLRRTGHDVVVLERAPRIDPLGAGITLFANAMRALDRLGVREAVAVRGALAERSAILTWEHLQVDAELAQVKDRCSSPSGRVRREGKRERHPVLLSQRLAVLEHVVVARSRLDGETGGLELADELADVLPHRHPPRRPVRT